MVSKGNYKQTTKYKRKAKKPLNKYAKRRCNPKFAKAVMAVVNRKAEVKCQITSLCTNLDIYHNTMCPVYQNAFRTVLGPYGDVVGTAAGNRIGNEIFLKGLKISLLIESQQYRPQVSYWLYLVKRLSAPEATLSAKNDMFEGVSSHVPCDYVDTSKVHVLYCKKFTLRAPNMGTLVNMSTVSATGVGTLDQASGTAWTVDTEDYKVMTNPKYHGKLYIPINKKIKYQDAGDLLNTPIGSHNYQWVLIGYDTMTTITGDGLAPLGHITMSQKLYFTDV